MVELLAPAGKEENLKFALLYGADAVYFGGQNYSLRANAKNFNLEEIKNATIYAHSLNKKVYVTVNIVFHDDNFEGLKEYLLELDKIGVDGIIASDIAVIKLAKELDCRFSLTLSTQASCYNAYTAKFWENLGVDRVVLARESNKDDMIIFKEKTNMELEVFIHGAMCTSFSGKCVLSNYMTNRDSNRGGCAQICRWEYKTDNNEVLTIMPKDLNMVSYIKELMEIGVDSFKIEGRMRSIYYVATVILVYRRLIDLINANKLTEKLTTYYLNILNRCANRDSKSQFFDKLPGVEEQYFNGRDEQSNQDFLGLVKEVNLENNLILLEQRNYFSKGDVVQFFGPNIETFDFTIDKFYDENMVEIDVARHPQMNVYLKIDKKVNVNDMMRKKVFDIV